MNASETFKTDVSGAGNSISNDYNDYARDITLTVRGDGNFIISECSNMTINHNYYYNNLEYSEIFESAFKQGFETALRLLENHK